MVEVDWEFKKVSLVSSAKLHLQVYYMGAL